MPAYIEHSNSEDGEVVGPPTIVNPGRFRPIEFKTEERELRAVYFVAVTHKDLMTKILSWTTPESLESYSDDIHQHPLPNIEVATEEKVINLINGKAEVIIGPELAPEAPLPIMVVTHMRTLS